jgi:hypothetical protein
MQAFAYFNLRHVYARQRKEILACDNWRCQACGCLKNPTFTISDGAASSVTTPRLIQLRFAENATEFSKVDPSEEFFLQVRSRIIEAASKTLIHFLYSVSR